MHRSDEGLEGESGDLFARGQLRNYAAFVTGAVRRHKRLVAAVLFTVLALSVAVVSTLPRTYHVEAKLLAQRNQVLAVRGDGPDSVAPTRGAAESVLRRDNLVAIVVETDLVTHYREHQSLSQRAIGAVLRPLQRDESDQDRIEAMADLLEKRLLSWTSESTVTIAIDWPDAQMACRLVDAAQTSFLARRHALEITALAESISIIGSHAARLQANIDAAVAGVAKLHGGTPVAGDAGAPIGGSAWRPAARADGARLPELARLRVVIEAKQRAVDELDQARRQRLAEVQTRLVEQRATFTDNHPAIADLQQTIVVLSRESAQVKGLNQEVASLRADYQRESAAERAEAPGAPPAPLAAPAQLPGELLRLDQELREDRDPRSVYARAQLRDAMDKHAALRAQVQVAEIDLETAQAAFKYRYSVLTPAQLPKRPVKPNVILVLLAAFVGAVFASILAAVVSDVRGGRLVERWQVESLLDRPVLGEIHFGRLSRHDPR